MIDDLVSIIMPSYNTSDYILDSINSVLAQTYENWELIIVDDCSTDNSEEKVNLFVHDPRVIFIKNEKNVGAAISRNRAIREAHGRYIAFLDSDDIWLPDKLSKQIKFMKEGKVKYSYTEYAEINEQGECTGIHVSGPKIIRKGGMFRYCWCGCLTVMYDVNAVGLLQIADIKKNNDYAMWLKISKREECRLLEEELALYRRGRKDSISSESIFELIKWHYFVFRIGENESIVMACMHTLGNLFFGFMKKIIYVKRIH